MRQWGREKPHGQLAVVAGRRPQQEVGHAATCARRRARSSSAGCSPTADVARRELPPRHAGALGPRLRRAAPRINPRLIITRVTGFGQTGPYAPRAGYGSIGEAMGGLRYVTGDPDRPPSRAGISIGDSLAATLRLHRHPRRAARARAHRPRPGRRLGDLRGRARDDGVACVPEWQRGRLPARAHRRDAAEHRARPTSTPPRTASSCSSPPTRTRSSAGWPRRWAQPELADRRALRHARRPRRAPGTSSTT